MFPVLLLDAGLALVTIGGLSLLGGATRGLSAPIAGIGLLLAVVALAVPPRAIRLQGPALALDRLMPEYEFGESHEIRIRAPAERVYRAVREVTAPEIRFFRLLTWIRSPRLPGQGKESILNPSMTRPILDVALDSSFLLVHEEPGREVVVGTLVCCENASRPKTGAELLAMQRRGSRKGVHELRRDRRGRRLHARRHADAHSRDERRGLAPVRASTGGSSTPAARLIRRMWLRAIRDRAQVSG